MTVQEIRLANLRSLAAHFGSVREVADLTGTSEGHLREILRGDKLKSGKTRGVGNDVARKLERGTGMPEGWMDVNHDAPPQDPPGEQLTPEERTLLTLFRRAGPELQAAIMQVSKLAK